MALDLTVVKKIMIPVVVQPTATWHELSLTSGQESRYFADGSYDTNNPTSSFAYTTQGTGDTPRIRITFAWSGNAGYTYTFKVNGETVSSLSSPLDITPTVSSAGKTLIQIIQQDPNYSDGYRRLSLTAQYSSTYDRLSFELIGNHGSTNVSGLSGEFRLTVSKLEQYYADDPTPVVQNVEVKQIKDANNVVIWDNSPKLTSITLSGYNTSLYSGTTFLFGGTVTAHYTDNSTANVTSSTTFSGYNMNTVGTQTVTATYTERGITQTATYELTILASPSWHTVWSGSKSVSWTITSSGAGDPPSTQTVYELPGDIHNPTGAKLRFTFSMSNKLGAGKYFKYTGSNPGATGAWSESSKPSSPLTVNSLDVTIPTSTNTTALPILGVEATTSSSETRGQCRIMFELMRYKLSSTTYSRFRIRPFKGESSSGTATGTISLTLTKIEEYY